MERAKALGDYLIVGVTADDFDKSRGKINTKQSLIERIEGVKQLGIADKIIVEEYSGQKIDDIKKYNVDIFAIGSDWKGIYDYLNDYCEVVYLDRTEGISSTDIRSSKELTLSYIGDNNVLVKFYKESSFVNGLRRGAVCTNNKAFLGSKIDNDCFTEDVEEAIDSSDLVYILSTVDRHDELITECLNKGKNVICESPITDNLEDFDKLFKLADEKKLLVFDSIKTAYATAYHRLILLIKSGMIGDVVSVEATCSSMSSSSDRDPMDEAWTGILKWGPTAMLPVFDILGTQYKYKSIVTCKNESKVDKFTHIQFVYDKAIGSIKVGKGFKSEGILVISGTKGCLYVDAPWWKTDYFEVHFEDSNENKKYFYQLDGEGIRNELVQFVNNINEGKRLSNIDYSVSRKIVEVIEDYNNNKDVKNINF